MQKIKRTVLVICLILVIVLVGVGASWLMRKNKVETARERASIVATNFPAYDFARAVVGDKAKVKMLLKPGAESHSFEPSPQDIKDIKSADLFIYNGGESDEWVEKILRASDMKVQSLKMMDAVKTLPEERTEGMEAEDEEQEAASDGQEEVDEHVWTTPKNAIKIIDNIEAKISAIKPAQQTVFKQNAAKYKKQLQKIDADFRAVVKNARQREMIFADRFPFRYFSAEYGIKYYAAFSGCAEKTEATSKTIAFLVQKVKQRQLKYILKIELSDGRGAEAVARESGAKIKEFNSAHNISQADFERGLTYAQIMRQNVLVLKQVLN